MSHAKLEVRMESLLPFLQGTCTPYNMPVYPGAQRIIANALIDTGLVAICRSVYRDRDRKIGHWRVSRYQSANRSQPNL
jgi:hypothetical protein